MNHASVRLIGLVTEETAHDAGTRFGGMGFGKGDLNTVVALGTESIDLNLRFPFGPHLGKGGVRRILREFSGLFLAGNGKENAQNNENQNDKESITFF